MKFIFMSFSMTMEKSLTCVAFVMNRRIFSDHRQNYLYNKMLCLFKPVFFNLYRSTGGRSIKKYLTIFGDLFDAKNMFFQFNYLKFIKNYVINYN